MLPLTQILIHSSFISFYLLFIIIIFSSSFFFISFSVNEIIIIIKIKGQNLGYDNKDEVLDIFLKWKKNGGESN